MFVYSLSHAFNFYLPVSFLLQPRITLNKHNAREMALSEDAKMHFLYKNFFIMQYNRLQTKLTDLIVCFACY